VDRRTLAMRAAQVFELDPTLLDFSVPPPPEAFPSLGAADAASGRAASLASIPFDTSLDATRTAAALDTDLPDLTELLRRMCSELAPA
jgi:hypothetical protein